MIDLSSTFVIDISSSYSFYFLQEATWLFVNTESQKELNEVRSCYVSC